MKAVLFAGICFLLRKSIDFEASLPTGLSGNSVLAFLVSSLTVCTLSPHYEQCQPYPSLLQPGTLPHGRTFQAIPKAHASLQPKADPESPAPEPPTPADTSWPTPGAGSQGPGSPGDLSEALQLETARMRGKAKPLENAGLSVPGSVQCNILLTPATESGLSRSWAHVHAHRMGGNLHNSQATSIFGWPAHTKLCLWFGIQSLSERADCGV